MTATEWLNGKQDWDSGLKIYENSRWHNSRLLRIFKKKRDFFALKYELQKIAKKERIFQRAVPETKPGKQQKPAKPKTDIAKEQTERHYPKVFLKDLPKALHPAFIKQKQTFYAVSSLKMELNDLPDDEVAKAEAIIRKIFDAWAVIDLIWQRIDYWLINKQLMNVNKNDFSDKSPVELVKIRQLMYQRLSKRKKTIEKIIAQIEQESDEKKLKKLHYKLKSKQEALHQLEMDIYDIGKILNNG